MPDPHPDSGDHEHGADPGRRVDRAHGQDLRRGDEETARQSRHDAPGKDGRMENQGQTGSGDCHEAHERVNQERSPEREREGDVRSA